MALIDFPHNNGIVTLKLYLNLPFLFSFSLKYPDCNLGRKNIKTFGVYTSLINRVVIVFPRHFIEWETFNLLKYRR